MIKINNLKLKIRNCNRGMTHSTGLQGHPEYSRGMTYVELIVVLSIFSVMSSYKILQTHHIPPQNLFFGDGLVD